MPELPDETSDEHPAVDAALPVESEEPANEPVGTGMFVLLAISIAALVGAGVYVAGQATKASDETAQAAERSNQILDDTDVDIGEFIDPSPSSIPLTDTTVAPVGTTEAPSTTEPDDGRTIAGDGNHPEVDIDPESIAIAFINRAPGDDYEKVGIVTFEGERIITQLRCSRIDLNADRGLCLTPPGDFVLSGHGLILDEKLVPTAKFDVNDPSRAVVSPDGSIVGWTGFTAGHSYANFGEFSTITQLIAVDRQLAVNLETDFKTEIDGEPNDTPERNFWGVTFVDNEIFYATMQNADGTWIVEGSLSTSKIVDRFDNASCPEVSPDGQTIVAKEQRADGFHLVAIDVATGTRRDLGETRPVDDQVEWLDDTSIVYAIANPDEGTAAQPAFDVYVLDTSPGGTPQLLVPFADSPVAK